MLALSPDPSAPAVSLPPKNWRVLAEPATTVELDALRALPAPTLSTLRVRTGHFVVHAALNTAGTADRLVVTFHGARGGRQGAEGRRPMFFRPDFDALYGCPILALSDPQTELDWGSHLPRVGLYVGTFAHDLVPELLCLIERVRELLGVPAHRVVLVGPSAGATAALMVGARRGAATGVIAVAPFLRPDHYRPPIVAAVARAAGGALADWQRGVTESPERFNPLVALRNAWREGRELRVVVAQNTLDQATIQRHFPGLWRRFDIDPEGGVSPDGRVMAALFASADGGGHGPEPHALALPLYRMAQDFFDRPLAAQASAGHAPGAAGGAGEPPADPAASRSPVGVD